MTGRNDDDCTDPDTSTVISQRFAEAASHSAERSSKPASADRRAFANPPSTPAKHWVCGCLHDPTH